MPPGAFISATSPELTGSDTAENTTGVWVSSAAACITIATGVATGTICVYIFSDHIGSDLIHNSGIRLAVVSVILIIKSNSQFLSFCVQLLLDCFYDLIQGSVIHILSDSYFVSSTIAF